MKKILFLVIISINVHGQTYYDLQVDTTFKTLEFYVGQYQLFYNLQTSGEFYELKDDFKFKSGDFVDSPGGRKTNAKGTWTIDRSSNTLKVTAKNKTEIIEKKIYKFYWKITSDLIYSDDKPLIFDKYCIVLVDMAFADSKLIPDELDRFIEKRFKPLDKNADPMAYFEENQQISRLCYEFFMTKDMFCGMREYRNGKLWTR